MFLQECCSGTKLPWWKHIYVWHLAPTGTTLFVVPSTVGYEGLLLLPINGREGLNLLCIHNLFFTFGPKAGSHMNTLVSIYWHALILSLRAEVLKLCWHICWKCLGVILLRKKGKKNFFISSPYCLNCFCPAIDCYCWAALNLFNRWCHWIASLLSLLCNQQLCSIQVWRCYTACVCVCVNDYTTCTSSFTDHSL